MFRKAESELRHTLQMLSDIQLALNKSSIVTVINPDGLLMYLNERARQILIYPKESNQPAFEVNFRDLLVPHQSASLLELSEAVQNGQAWHGELQIKSLFGQVHWIQTTVVPFLGEDKHPTHYISISMDITGQKETELALKEREEQLRALINALPESIFFMDSEGRWLEANENVLSLFRVADLEWRGKFTHDIAKHPELSRYISELNKLCERAFEDKAVVSYDTVRQLQDNYIYIEGSVLPIFHENGSRHGAVVIERDITELKKIQAELMSSHQIFESIVQNGADAIAIVNLAGEILRVNPSWEEIYGWKSEEVHGRKLPYETAQSRQWQETAILGCVVPSLEVVRQRKDGTPIHVNVTTSPVFDSQNNVIAVCHISRDVTELVKKQQELSDAKQELESFIEHSADSISVVNLKGEVLRVNPAHERVFGWTADEVVGQHFPFQSQAERQEILQWIELIRNGERLSALETVHHRKNGEPVHISVTASPIHDAEGSIVAMSVISRDITSQINSKELLNRSEKLSVVGQMAASVAHEIRNPLASLQGFAQLIREQSKDHLVDRYSSFMLEEFQRINSILNEFLLLAKPQKAQHKRSNLMQILRDVLTLIQTQANDKNLVLNYSFEPQDVYVDCIENELKQVFINILKNAVEATPNGKRIHLDIVRVTDGQVLVRCTDEGCGIPKEQIQKLGSPFFTTKPNGTGLGLMVTYRIVESHGGRMTIQSEEKAGTVVQVRLPISNSMTGINAVSGI